MYMAGKIAAETVIAFDIAFDVLDKWNDEITDTIVWPELYKQLSQFIKTGEDAKIKIPFPEFSRRIKGELSNATYKPCWVKLEME